MFSDDFRYFLAALHESKISADVYNCWTMISSKYPDTRITIGVENETYLSIPQSLKFNSFDNKAYLKSYYSTDSLFCLNSNLMKKMSLEGTIKLNIDYSIFLDTNLAIYINNFVQRNPLVKNPSKNLIWRTIVEAIEHLLNFDLDYNYSYYILENTKLIFPVYESYKNSNCKPQEFWKQLNPNFKNNLISSILFASIDRQAYRSSPSLKFRLTKEEAETEAIKIVYDTYFGKYADIPVKFMTLFNNVYLHLIKTFQIHFASNKSPKNKLLQLLDYMHNYLGFIMARESIIAFKLFDRKNRFRIFNPINKKHWEKDQLEYKLRNITWDLMIPRFVETYLANLENYDLFLPYFLTFDEGLNHILDLYPVRGIVYEAKSHQITPISDIDICSILKPEEQEKYFSKSAIQERQARKIDINSDEFAKLIETELNKLFSILTI